MAVNRCRAGTAPADRRVGGARLAVLMVSIVAVVSAIHPLPVGAITGDAQQLLDLINQERAAIGAQPLTLRDDLVQIATEHSAWMAATGSFQHRSNLAEGVTGPWTRIGENIAYGWSVSQIHQSFMQSTGHCENNLYAGFNRVGIEFATSGSGAMYVTVVFVQESGGSLPKPTVCPYDYSTTTTTAPPPTTTTSVPPTTTTTTTAPPTTTTSVSPTTTLPPTTTTTLPVTTTTVPPSTTTPEVTSAVELVLPLPSTTTTTGPARPVEDSGAAGEFEVVHTATIQPVIQAARSTKDVDPAGGLPVLPIAGGTAFLAAAGIWLTTSKRAAVRAISARWEIPHGGVRPPH